MKRNMDDPGASWLSYHIYYFQDLNLVVQRLVRPLLLKLLAADLIEKFFFVRYRLGGPHIRLRLWVRTGRTDAAAAAAESEAKSFFRRSPSRASLSAEEIRQKNKVILASDLNEWDDSVYPDSSFRAAPFRPETERYGGAGLLEASLDFFVVSSVAALELLDGCGAPPRSRLLSLAAQILTCQALSFARDAEDLIPLLRYGVDAWGEAMPRAAAKAESTFSQQRNTFRQFFHRELRRLKSPPAALSGTPEEIWEILGAATRRLSRQARAADQATHQRIGGSQLHMTANRLGLSNAEEVYISRSPSMTAAEIFRRESEPLDELSQGCRFRNSPVAIEAALPDLVRYALARFALFDQGEE